jgi:phosphate transport system permease protein
MNLGIFTAILLFCIFSYFFGQTTAKKLVTNQNLKLKTLPTYYGYFVALWCGIPSLILFAVWSLFEPTIIKTIVVGKVLSASQIEAGLTTNLIYQKIKNNNARNDVENILKWLLFSSSVIAILTTLGIIFSLLFESIKFFSSINIFDFLFGTNWSPQKAFVRDASAITAEEYLEIKDAFGSVPLFAGTAFIALIAMCVAVPIGLFSGIYLAEYASYKSRRTIKPIIEILAGIPTVVYGFFAALTVGPFFREFGESLGLNVSSESALAAGLVMGIMIIPYVSSLSDDVINAVPQSLREGSYAVGATKSETIKKVVFPAALPGIIGSILLAVSRAIGETMIVVMAAGLAANLTINPLESTTTVTTQIVMLLVGDQEFDSPKTQSAFALGLTLFLVTLVLNYIALRVVKKYREKYD